MTGLGDTRLTPCVTLVSWSLCPCGPVAVAGERPRNRIQFTPPGGAYATSPDRCSRRSQGRVRATTAQQGPCQIRQNQGDFSESGAGRPAGRAVRATIRRRSRAQDPQRAALAHASCGGSGCVGRWGHSGLVRYSTALTVTDELQSRDLASLGKVAGVQIFAAHQRLQRFAHEHVACGVPR